MLRVNVLTIFPDFFAPLDLSLPGKAAAKGLVEFGVHDLRAFGHRSRMMQAGYAREEFMGRPVIAVVQPPP